MEFTRSIDPQTLLWSFVLMAAFALVMNAGLFVGSFALLSLRLMHILLGVACAFYLGYRLPFVRAVMVWEPAKWLTGIALSGFVWIARSDVSQAIGHFFRVDGSAMPLTLNAGTVVLSLINGTFAVGAVLTTFFFFWAGGALGLYGARKLWHKRSSERSSFRSGMQSVFALCFAFWMVVANAVAFDEKFLQYALRLSVFERDALPSNACTNVKPADRILFLGPPYTQILVISPPVKRAYLGIDRIGPFPEFTVQGVRECARGEAGEDAGLGTG